MTSLTQTIESKDLTVGELLTSFYVVPSYQREFVWGEEEVEQLLTDVFDEYAASDGADSEYFIGSLVVLARDDSSYELIDGQQRLTTLFVILCGLRDFLKPSENGVPATLLNQISAPSMNANGDEVHRYRVQLQYDDSRGVLEAIGEGTPPNGGNGKTTRSVANIVEAYETVLDFMKRQFGDDPHAARRYYAFLINRVKLIRVRAGSTAHALKVFETINDRGVGLDSMDLLKNLLFMKAGAEQFEELKKLWKEVVDTVHRAREKPLRFLRYFVLANYKVERLREDEIYRWITENAAQVGYERNPVAFAQELLQGARAYSSFVSGKNVDGSKNRYLDNLRRLSGMARQHLILLLAAGGLDKPAFDELCRHVENLFFAYVIAREPTKTFEVSFTNWSREIRQVSGMEGVRQFVEKNFEPVKRELASRFDLSFASLKQSDLQRYRLMYVIAKLTQFVDEVAKGSAAAADLETYTQKDVHLEHILPQTPTVQVREAFDASSDYEQYVGRLGNLTLLERSINVSISNGLFSAKKSAYAKSGFLLTQSLAQSIAVGLNTAYTRAAAYLEAFETWDSAAIERRQRMLARIARRVWEVPEVTVR